MALLDARSGTTGDAASGTVRSGDTLAERAARWRSLALQGDTGPLVIAHEVVALAERWADYEAQADGLSCEKWLQKAFGRGRSVAWWRARANAVRLLGEACRRRLHHEVAIRVARVADTEVRKALLAELYAAARANGGNPLTRAQAQPHLRDAGVTLHRNRCARCAKLEAALEAALQRISERLPTSECER